MMRRLGYASLLIAVSLLAGAAAPVPERKADPLAEVEAGLKSGEAHKAELQKSLEDAEREREEIQRDLVSQAAKIQTAEADLSKLEDHLAELEAQRSEIEGRIKVDEASLSRLLAGLLRMARVPPEAVIARPGTPIDSARSAMILKDVLPVVRRRADALKADLATLAGVVSAVAGRKAELEEVAETLRRERATMEGLLNRREGMVSSVKAELTEQEKDLKKLAAKAKDLRDFLAKIEARNREQAAARARNKVREKPIPRLKGTHPGRLPAAGSVDVAYGEQDAIGAESRGLHIATGAGALVVAPMPGVVRFAGSFKGFGQMVLIEHGDGLHSLVAGLSRIDTVVGQTVAAGEPIGSMGRGDEHKRPSLYFEIRRDGRPVDPSSVISGLG